MRYLLLTVGLLVAVVGLIVGSAGQSELKEARDEVKAAESLVSLQYFNNSTYSSANPDGGYDADESGVEAAEARVEKLEGRPALGWTIAGVGALIAVCGVFVLVSQASAQQPAAAEVGPSGSAELNGSDAPLAERLRVLDGLREEGAITEEEHAARRAALLDSI